MAQITPMLVRKVYLAVTRVSLLTGLPLNDQLVPQIGTQICHFLGDGSEEEINCNGEEKTTKFGVNQLVVIWGGANDLRDIEGPAGIRRLAWTLTGHVQTVIDNEAKQVLVLNP